MHRHSDAAYCGIPFNHDVERPDPPAFRVFEYEVTAENVAYGITRVCSQKRVVAKAIAHAAHAEIDGTYECLFRLDELPLETPVRFVIRPLNCFGLSGRPLATAPVRLPLE